jgi:hypothetical protein
LVAAVLVFSEREAVVPITMLHPGRAVAAALTVVQRAILLLVLAEPMAGALDQGL